MKQSTESAEQFAKFVADGVSADIYLAFEAHGIFRAIGERVALANASRYQAMLVALQAYASAEFVLSLTRLLERQRGEFELHSVHGVLMYLRDHACEIPVQESLWVEQSMDRLGMRSAIPNEPGPEQTCAVVDVLVSKLPHHSSSKAHRALKELRDKRIAHPERVTAAELSTTSWEEALKLLEIPLEALGVCGAYTGTAYVDDQGKFMMEADAGSAGNATRRFLEAAGVAGSKD